MKKVLFFILLSTIVIFGQIFAAENPSQSSMDTTLYENCLEIIDSLDLLSEEGIIVAEHGVRDYVPETVGSLEIIKERKYGKIMVTIYAKKSEVHTEEEEANE